MLVTNHVLSGALVGLASRGPARAFVAGVASHFALDAVPHWGDVTWEEMLPIAYRDGLLGLGAIGVVAAATPPERRLRVLAGMAGAAFPDLDKPSRLFFGRSPFPAGFDAVHLAIQRESRDRMGQEIVVGLGLLSVALVAVRRQRRLLPVRGVRKQPPEGDSPHGSRRASV